MPGEAKHYETRKLGVVLSKPHSPFLYFPKYLFLSRNFLENQKRPFTPGSILSPFRAENFSKFQKPHFTPWVTHALPHRNPSIHPPIPEIFREMKRAIYPTGVCIYETDAPIFAAVIFSLFSSYFGTIIFDFRIIGWVRCSPYSLLSQSSSP
jgi:hypothetical protein